MKSEPGWKVRAALAILAAALPVGAAPASAAEGIRWEIDLATAQQAARQSNRLVWIHFGGPWCGPCMMLERNVFSQPGFGRELTADYVGVKIDPRSSPEAKAIAAKYGIERYPFDVITTYTGQLVVRTPSPTTVRGYVAQWTTLARQVKPESYDAAPTATSSASPPQVASQAPASGQTPASSQAAARPADERYADYYNRRQTAEREPYQPLAENQIPPAVTQPPVQPASQTASAPADRYATQSADRYAEHREPSQSPAEEQLAEGQSSLESKIPPGNPPLALEGYCPVTLLEQRVWQEGDPKIGIIHRQRLYLFANEEAKQRFWANPDNYSPVCRGHDPVLVLDHNQAVPGRREYGVFYGKRIYLFANEATRQQFEQNPKRYEAEIMQAMRQ